MDGEGVKALLKFFSDPCGVFAHVRRVEPGEYQVELGRRKASVRVVRERLCRAAVDTIRYAGTLVRDGPCLVYKIGARVLMAFNVPSGVAVIAVKKRGNVAFYVLE